MDLSTDPAALARICQEAQDRTAAVAAALVARFHRAMTPEFIEAHRFLYYCTIGHERDPNDILAVGPIKYAADFRSHLEAKLPFLPFMRDLAGCKVYEIGVGAGFMLYLLRAAMGCEVNGCDIHAATHEVYRPLREALGVQEVTQDCAVTFGQPFSIPPGTEALVALWPAFMRHMDPASPVYDHGISAQNWGRAEHEWFVNHCSERLTGVRKLVVRFNRQGLLKNPPVRDFYRSIGSFPIREDPRFCVVAL